MFGNSTLSNGLTLGKVLNGISKTLSVANQIIPLYQQAKPMISNAKTILSAVKGLNTHKQIKDSQKAEKNNENLKIQLNDFNKNNNNPVFFQ